jgi:hypothetical protein
MKQIYKEAYEAPLAEVLEVKAEENLLTSVEGIQSERSGGGYGDAIEEDWN